MTVPDAAKTASVVDPAEARPMVGASAPSVPVTARRTEAVDPRASAICEATVRFQISS